MNAKQILDRLQKIVKRQDFDRDLAIFFINSVRKGLLREYDIRKFYRYVKDVPCINGIVDTNALNAKNIRRVEWVNNNTIVPLERILNYEDAADILANLDTVFIDGGYISVLDEPGLVGSARYYIEIGTNIHILPTPPIGSINLFGEFWPNDLEDKETSKDITTDEVGECLIYLGAAEYFDMLGEENLGNFWRKKGIGMVQAWITGLRRNLSQDTEILFRDPFGNNVKQPKYDITSGSTPSIDTIDLGGWK